LNSCLFRVWRPRLGRVPGTPSRGIRRTEALMIHRLIPGFLKAESPGIHDGGGWSVPHRQGSDVKGLMIQDLTP